MAPCCPKPLPADVTHRKRANPFGARLDRCAEAVR